jgi:hypothetical protein
LAEQKTVVITGSTGRIGTILRQAFEGRYRLRCIDRVPTPGVPDAVVASLTDPVAILPAFRGADAVVHLAADPRHTPDIGWDTLMPDNVVASANVYEAARKSGVKRVVFFSSMHVCGMYENDPPWSRIAAGDYAGLDPQRVALVTTDMPARPDGLYAVSKIFGEALGKYYAEASGTWRTSRSAPSKRRALSTRSPSVLPTICGRSTTRSTRARHWATRPGTTPSASGGDERSDRVMTRRAFGVLCPGVLDSRRAGVVAWPRSDSKEDVHA